jgi:hypothetical protein
VQREEFELYGWCATTDIEVVVVSAAVQAFIDGDVTSESGGKKG